MSQKDVAQGFGVSRVTVFRWHNEGMPRNADGSYNLPDCIDWFSRRAGAEPTPESQESQRWLTAFRKERALIVKLERKRLEGTLIPVEEVEWKFTDRAHAFSKALQLLARRVAFRTAGESKKEYQAVFDIIEEETNAILTVYSRPIPGIHDDNEKTRP